MSFIKYTKNENYFYTIDTPAKAYLLGMIYADGNIHKSLRRLRLKLIEEDKNILDFFKKEIEYNGPLYFCKKNQIGKNNLLSLEINSTKMVIDLKDKGVDIQKSLTVDFPNQSQVSELFLSDFIQGYFDGDGSICLSKNHKNHITVSFCVSRNFGEKLKEILKNKLELHSTLFLGKNKKIHYLSISGAQQCLKFLDFIYLDKNIFIKRKYEKYINFKQKNKLIRIGVSERKTSKYIGVYFLNCKNRYIAFTKINNKILRFGSFKTEIEAAKNYNLNIINLKIEKKLNIFI